MACGILAAMAIIAVFNQKGGVGRTTTALNVLAAAARRGRRPLGIDLDPQGHLSDVFGVRPQLAADSICAFFAGQRALADVAQITRSGVVLCPAHADLAAVDVMLGKSYRAITRLRDALREADAPTGPVVVDCGRLPGALWLNAVFACDVVLVPVSCDYLSLRGALQVDRTLNALEPVLKRRPARRYLLTRFDVTRETGDKVAAQLSAAVRAGEICATRIREDASVAESPAAELDVFRHAPASMGAQDYEALGAELMGAGFLD
jgi:chromosome partitioning protein